MDCTFLYFVVFVCVLIWLRVHKALWANMIPPANCWEQRNRGRAGKALDSNQSSIRGEERRGCKHWELGVTEHKGVNHLCAGLGD